MAREKGSLNKKTLEEAVSKQRDGSGVPRIILFLEGQGIPITKENFRDVITPYLNNISSRKKLLDFVREYGFVPPNGMTYTMCGIKDMIKFFVELSNRNFTSYTETPAEKTKVATSPIVATIEEEEIKKKRGRPKKEATANILVASASQQKIQKKKVYDTSPKSERVFNQKLVETLMEEIIKINNKLDRILLHNPEDEVSSPKGLISLDSLREKYILSFPTKSASDDARGILTSVVSTKEAIIHIISDVCGNSLDEVCKDFKNYDMDQIRSIIIPTITEEE